MGGWVAWVLSHPPGPTSGGGTAQQYTVDPIESQAQLMLANLIARQPRGTPVAAAYVQTTYARFVGAQADSAGLPSAAEATDIVVVLEVDGWFPGAHHALAGTSADATEILAPYDVTRGVDLPWSYAFNPASPDIPGAAASASAERFVMLRHYGTPIALALP